MKMLIHDLKETEYNELFPDTINDVIIVSDNKSIQNCIGCFGCWVKTPGVCVIRDQYGDMGEFISKCEEVIIISKCFYGGYSPFVKNVMDRCISYIHPYFEIRNGEMHHKQRYDKHFDLQVWFYGENITEQEKSTAEKLIKANSINMECRIKKISFVQKITEIKEWVTDEVLV